jgi:GH15 family glucan-1,4-alpha-glucosidase
VTNATPMLVMRPGSRRNDGFLPIEDYAAIGDGLSIALVGLDGSIDWLCLPQLDGPSVLGALLDPAEGGSFSLAPTTPFSASRRYLPGTNVLETDYRTDHGSVRVTDALTVGRGRAGRWRELVRCIEGRSGEVPMRWRLRPRFDYGSRGVEPELTPDRALWRHGRIQLALRAWNAGEPSASSDAVDGALTVKEGMRAMLVLVAGDGPALTLPEREEVQQRLDATLSMWREWIGGSSYQGPWKQAVERSLLTLRLLSRSPGGAIAAAGTTSLPETLGGERNYDYRFAWVRDLSFSADALLNVGMRELAHDAVAWLLDAVSSTRPRVDPVYRLDGRPLRAQQPLTLDGYRASKPVYTGNQAGTQLQLGGFGDLLETIWLCVDSGSVLAPDAGQQLADSVELLCAIWENQDAGLWELGDYAHYATSKLGCWTALRRALDLAACDQIPARDVSRWRVERDRIHRFIETRLWSESRRSYVMKAGGELLDCGVLLASRRGYGDPGGERMRSTIAAIREELHADGPLLYRYSGMAGEENAFLACSFWLVEALALAGQRDEAAEMMDALVALGNDVGLYSEEMEPGSHAMLGNFPQALTHLALINAAASIGEG